MDKQDKNIVELRDLLKKYNISNSDIIALSNLQKQKDNAGVFGKPKIDRQQKQIAYKKYDLKFLDYGGLLISLRKLPEITSENIDTFFYTTQETLNNERNADNEKIVFKKIDTLKEEIRALSEIEIPKPTKFKALISEKEEEIISVGNDEKLFEFLKIDVFLNDFRNNIAANVNGIQEFLNSRDFKEVEFTITEAERKNRGEYTMEELKYKSSYEGTMNKLKEMTEGTWESNEKKLAKFYGVGDMLQGTVESAVLTFNLYESYAISCVVFFLNKKRINYFEIHSAFEKLGVFDSTWEKSVKTKLEGIEARLDLINNQLVNLNAEFSNLIESNERTAELISEGLKEIKSSVDANTVVSAFTAYQMYKVNKNTKGLRE